MDFVTKIRSIKLSEYIMRIWDSFYVTVGPHTFKMYSHEEEEYHEKEKVTVVYLVYKSIDFSYIQSSFGYDWGGWQISIKR